MTYYQFPTVTFCCITESHTVTVFPVQSQVQCQVHKLITSQEYITQENLVSWPKVTSSAWFTLELEKLSFYPGQLLLKCLYCLPVFFLQVPDLISEIVPESFILGCQLTQSLSMLCFHDHILRLYCAEPKNSINTKYKKHTTKILCCSWQHKFAYSLN